MVKSIEYVQGLLQTLLVKDNKGSLRNRLVRGAAGSFGVRIIATGLNFLISILLARLLGASGFGTYTYAFAWTELLSLLTMLGLDNLLVREVSIYQTQSAWSLIRGLLRWANQIVLLVSVGLALVAVGIAWNSGMGGNSQMLLTFSGAMVLMPIAALRNIRMAAMRGLHQIVMGQLPEMILAPLLLMALTGCLYLLLGESLTVPWVAAMRVVAAGITLTIGNLLLNRALPNAVKEATPKYQVGSWLRCALPFVLLGSMFAIKTRTDILMLGAIEGPEAAGIFLAVSRGAQLIGFILMAVNTALGPNIASLYAQGNKKQLERVVVKSSRAVLLTSLPVTATLIGFRYWYMLLFGSEFTQGQNALIILCLGELVNAVMGSVGLLLNMTGLERYALINGLVSTGLNVILNLWLIPRWGIDGAAVATVSSSIITSIPNAIVVRKKLGIHCTALGKII